MQRAVDDGQRAQYLALIQLHTQPPGTHTGQRWLAAAGVSEKRESGRAHLGIHL